jgi:hypothetical protein
MHTEAISIPAEAIAHRTGRQGDRCAEPTAPVHPREQVDAR